MALPRGFKTDESFLEKIAIGATGTRKVIESLSLQGHKPIELERGSTSYKIWKAIKIKRERVPDLLCTSCGRRFESRAKTKMEITMSHSTSSSDRGWDHGLNDRDYVALVLCRRTGSAPLDWEANNLVQYIKVSELRMAWNNNLVLLENPKGQGEGFEKRVTWPAAIANSNGIVSDVNEEKLRYTKTGNTRRIPIRLTRKSIHLHPLVVQGQNFQEGQILAAVVPVSTSCPCTGGAMSYDYTRALQSKSLSERYAATKALAHHGGHESISALLDRINDDSEHIFVKVDAAAGLMKHEIEAGETFFRKTLTDQYLENRLEAVLVLSEVATQSAISLLIDTLNDTSQHTEIRAGAAWALGEIADNQALDALIASFDSIDLNIQIEAARALAKTGRKSGSKSLTAALLHGTPVQRPGIAWAIGKVGDLKLDDFSLPADDDNLRKWVAYVFGQQPEIDYYIEEIERIREKDSALYFAVTVLWQIAASWVDGLEEY